MADDNVDNEAHTEEAQSNKKTGGDNAGGDNAGADNSSGAANDESVLDGDQQLPPLIVQAGLHLLALVSAVALWAALDTWALVSSLALAQFFAVIGSIVFGIIMAQTLHEWSHFAGALISGAGYSVKPRPAILFFDFDFENNSRRQFLFMSWGGSIGNYLLVFLVLWLIPLDSAGRSMLLATAMGMAVFVGIIELPVIRLVMAGNSPMQALNKRFESLAFISQALVAGIITAMVTWIIV